MTRSCIEIKKDGVQCGSPALRNSLRCHWHAPGHVIKLLNRKKLDSIITAEGRIHAINEIVQALLSRQLDSKRAYTALYGVQMATQLSPNQDFDSNSPVSGILAGLTDLKP
ncbi:MAG: hypothetical protein ABIP81_04270 [Terriglobales bacterium]